MDRRKPCQPMLVSFGGVERFCYWPDEREGAETSLPFTPVMPINTIRDLTNLDLAQVLLRTGAGHGVGKPITGIDYIFGAIPGARGSIPDPAPPEPQFVLVSELTGAFDPEPRLDRTEYHGGTPGSKEMRVVYGNWQYHAGLPGNVHVVVTTNFPKNIVELVGRAITGAHAIQ
jgi:hypothetical protein